ncbi:MAG: diacylglycerol/lipid kinase family protein, partial [Bacillota bacterium]
VAPVKPEALPEIVICGLGTGSDLVKSLTDVSGPEGFRKLIKRGQGVRIDLGEISYTTDHGQVTRYFVNIADAGLGGAVVSTLKQGSARANGLLTYLLAGMKSILTYGNRYMRLKLDGRPVIEGPLNSIIVANGRFFAGGMEIAPMAEVNDGLLDILVVRNMNKLKTAFCFYRAYSGRHLSYKGVEYFRGKEVVIDSPERVLLDIDGETGGRLPARIRVYPRKLPVIVSPDHKVSLRGKLL